MAPTQKSFVWSFFEKTEDKKFAACNLCNQKLKYFTSTGNLRQHIIRKHPVQFREHGHENKPPNVPNDEPVIEVEDLHLVETVDVVVSAPETAAVSQPENSICTPATLMKKRKIASLEADGSIVPYSNDDSPTEDDVQEEDVLEDNGQIQGDSPLLRGDEVMQQNTKYESTDQNNITREYVLKRRKFSDGESASAHFQVPETFNKPGHLRTAGTKHETEFDVWCKSIAMQLNQMELPRALDLQLQIQSLVTKERIAYENRRMAASQQPTSCSMPRLQASLRNARAGTSTSSQTLGENKTRHPSLHQRKATAVSVSSSDWSSSPSKQANSEIEVEIKSECPIIVDSVSLADKEGSDESILS